MFNTCSLENISTVFPQSVHKSYGIIWVSIHFLRSCRLAWCSNHQSNKIRLLRLCSVILNTFQVCINTWGKLVQYLTTSWVKKGNTLFLSNQNASCHTSHRRLYFSKGVILLPQIMAVSNDDTELNIIQINTIKHSSISDNHHSDIIPHYISYM